MNKQLKFSGHTANPSDYECPDGDLAMTMDLWPENGAFRPVMQPAVKLTLSAHEIVVYVHETSEYKHYIIYNGSTRKLSWIDDGSDDKNPLSDIQYPALGKVDSIGNTLVVLDRSMAVSYYLWKYDEDEEENVYFALPGELPSVPISFGLKGRVRSYFLETGDFVPVTFKDPIDPDEWFRDFSEDNRTAITNQVMAKVNKFVADQSVNSGRFCFPFFVRYALRLYDGSLTKHSAPILMLPSTKRGVQVSVEDPLHSSGEWTGANCDIRLVAATLDYGLVKEASDIDTLSDWKDIVKSIEVFVSKPIYSLDINGMCERGTYAGTAEESHFVGQVVCKRNAQDVPVTSDEWTRDTLMDTFSPASRIKDAMDTYGEWSANELNSMFFGWTREAPLIELPAFDDATMEGNISSCSLFYKLCELSVDDVVNSNYRTARNDISVAEDYLQSLVNREVMTDDYLSHDTVIAEQSYVYNKRLNLCGIQRKPFAGFPISSIACRMTQDHIFTITDNIKYLAPSDETDDDHVKITILIRENGSDYKVETEGYSGLWHSSAGGVHRSFGCYLYYPNTNAYLMRVYSSTSGRKYDFNLKPHDLLNGAYANIGFEKVRMNHIIRDPLAGETVSPINDNEKLYTSEINNPFFFPVTGINTVGIGRIYAMSSAAKAMSQGQFGQYPLYAFTSDGVFALDVSLTTGAFSKVQPITRDICISVDSITQLDSTVLFATERGIMQLAGSSSECITDAVNHNGDEVFRLEQLPSAFDFVGAEGHSEYNFIDFQTFLQSCGILHDYMKQRVIVYNTNGHGYAYVYSLRQKRWAMMRSRITRKVNSYPEALAMTTDNKLVDFADPQSNQTPTTQVLVTRPLKLDYPDLHKTISNIITRGRFATGHVQSVLYGSRNLVNWFPVFTSTNQYLRGFRGTPYKYYRLLLKCTLDDDEYIAGSSIEFDTRIINQQR